MAKAVRRGDIVVPGDEVQAEMGEAVREVLVQGGYRRYEISNFARPGFEAVHNSLYWRGHEYAAVGCGACGFQRVSDRGAVLGRRWMNDRSPEKYMARVESTGLGEFSSEEIDAGDHLRERIFTALRLREGLDLQALENDLGLPVLTPFAKELEQLVAAGLAERSGDRLSLTDRGLDLHSEVALRFF